MVPTEENPQAPARAFHIPLITVDALELDRWAETPVTFTNSRWLKPIEREWGDGVTVAYRVLGYLVDIIHPVLQKPPIFVRRFPAASRGLARPLKPDGF
jgi:hypothetical protein